VANGPFLNLFAAAKPDFSRGSQKYQSEWNQLDQIIIHRRMSTLESTLHYVSGSARTFAPSFLLTDDKTWRGKRPYRTSHGYRYEAGYSDHLPVMADFVVTAVRKAKHE
jgi:hypothetical protein